MNEENMKKFFIEEIDLDIKYVSFNFVMNSVFNNIEKTENDKILSVYSLSIEKNKIDESNEKIKQKNDLISKRILQTKINNPVILLKPL